MFPYNFRRSHVRAIRGHSLCPARCLDHSSTRFQSNQAKTLQARAAALQHACRHLASKGATILCMPLCSHSWFLVIQWRSACFTECAFQDAPLLAWDSHDGTLFSVLCCLLSLHVHRAGRFVLPVPSAEGAALLVLGGEPLGDALQMEGMATDSPDYRAVISWVLPYSP